MRSASAWRSAEDGARRRAATLATVLLLAALLRASAGFAGEEPEPAGSVETAPPLALEALMRGMASSRGVVASFRERKQLSLLDVPLESLGTLYFVPPDRLARHMTQPTRSQLVIDGDRVRLLDASGEDAMDLSRSPVARVYLDNFTVLFGGDLAELERRYEVDFETAAERWTLRLVPRSDRVKRFVESVVLRGDPVAMREMVVIESDGDRTTTTFERVDPDHVFEAAELERLFGAADSPDPATGPGGAR